MLAGTAVCYNGKACTLPSPNLRMITGDSMCKTPCHPNVLPASISPCILPDVRELKQDLSHEIPAACPVGVFILWSIFSPRCWHGVNDHSADHRSHAWNPALRKPAEPQVAGGAAR